MANLTDVAESNALKWLVGQATTAPVTPLKLALVTANGTDAAAGTEVTGGSYARQSITFSAVTATGATDNSAAISFTNMPAVTVVGVEIWDSTATPVRWWHGALAANKTLNAGDTFEIPIADLDLSLA